MKEEWVLQALLFLPCAVVVVVVVIVIAGFFFFFFLVALSMSASSSGSQVNSRNSRLLTHSSMYSLPSGSEIIHPSREQ